MVGYRFLKLQRGSLECVDSLLNGYASAQKFVSSLDGIHHTLDHTKPNGGPQNPEEIPGSDLTITARGGGLQREVLLAGPPTKRK